MSSWSGKQQRGHPGHLLVLGQTHNDKPGPAGSFVSAWRCLSHKGKKFLLCSQHLQTPQVTGCSQHLQTPQVTGFTLAIDSFPWSASLDVRLFPHTQAGTRSDSGFSLRLLSISSLLPLDPTSFQQHSLGFGSSHSAYAAILFLQHCLQLRELTKKLHRRIKKKVPCPRCKMDFPA